MRPLPIAATAALAASLAIAGAARASAIKIDGAKPGDTGLTRIAGLDGTLRGLLDFSVHGQQIGVALAIFTPTSLGLASHNAAFANDELAVGDRGFNPRKPIPEPASAALLAAGLTTFLMARRRRAQ